MAASGISGAVVWQAFRALRRYCRRVGSAGKLALPSRTGQTERMQHERTTEGRAMTKEDEVHETVRKAVARHKEKLTDIPLPYYDDGSPNTRGTIRAGGGPVQRPNAQRPPTLRAPVDPFWKTGRWHTCHDCRQKFHCVADPHHACGSTCPACGSSDIRTDDIRHLHGWKTHPEAR